MQSGDALPVAPTDVSVRTRLDELLRRRGRRQGRRQKRLEPQRKSSAATASTTSMNILSKDPCFKSGFLVKVIPCEIMGVEVAKPVGKE